MDHRHVFNAFALIILLCGRSILLISILQKLRDKEVAGDCGGAGFCTHSLMVL